jgi:hypothetical protein
VGDKAGHFIPQLLIVDELVETCGLGRKRAGRPALCHGDRL